MCVRESSKYIIKSHLKYILILSPKYKYFSQKYYILFHIVFTQNNTSNEIHTHEYFLKIRKLRCEVRVVLIIPV